MLDNKELKDYIMKQLEDLNENVKINMTYRCHVYFDIMHIRSSYEDRQTDRNSFSSFASVFRCF